MKYFNLMLLTMILFSCSNNSDKVIDKSDDITHEEKVYKTVKTYITKNLDKIVTENDHKLQIDTIEILKIDTLTEKDILDFKRGFAMVTAQHNSQIIDIEMQKFELNKTLGVYEDKTLRDIATSDLIKLKEEQEKLVAKVDSFTELISNNPDSINLIYFAVHAKLTGTEEDMTQEQIDVPVLVTRKYRVVEFEDL